MSCTSAGQQVGDYDPRAHFSFQVVGTLDVLIRIMKPLKYDNRSTAKRLRLHSIIMDY